MMDWIIIHKAGLQWWLFVFLIAATILQFLLNMANQQQSDAAHGRLQKSVDSVVDKLEQLSKVEGLERYLQDIKIEALRKYVAKKDLEQLQAYLKDFSENLNTKNVEKLEGTVNEILKIIPSDPYFRIYKLLLKRKLINKFFEGKFKMVQVVRWDWLVGSGETAELYVVTTNENGEEVTYGPLINNTISMLDQPIRKFIQIRVESRGVGPFEWYPRTFRIGWAIAERKSNGTWNPLPELAEYDPYFRIDLYGNLEF